MENQLTGLKGHFSFHCEFSCDRGTVKKQSLCHISNSAVNSDVTVGGILQEEFKKHADHRQAHFAFFGQQVSVI